VFTSDRIMGMKILHAQVLQVGIHCHDPAQEIYTWKGQRSDRQ